MDANRMILAIVVIAAVAVFVTTPTLTGMARGVQQNRLVIRDGMSMDQVNIILQRTASARHAGGLYMPAAELEAKGLLGENGLVSTPGGKPVGIWLQVPRGGGAVSIIDDNLVSIIDDN